MTLRLNNPNSKGSVQPSWAKTSLALGLTLLFATGCATGKYGDSSSSNSSNGSGRSLTEGLEADGGGGGEYLLGDGSSADGSGSASSDGALRVLQPLAGARRSSMAFPTGDKRTSAIMLEREMPEEVILGVPFEYRIMVENLTERALDTVRVSDTVNGFQIDSTEPAGQVTGGLATWNLGALPARSTKTLVVKGVATAEGSLSTCASVDYESSLCATTSVVAPALQVALSAPESGLACDPFDLTVRVTNAGTGDARNVTVIDELPEGLSTLTGQRRVEMEFGTLAGGQTKEKPVKVKASGEGTFTHMASASAAGGLKSEAAPVTTILRQPALSLTMNTSDRVVAGRPIQSTMTVANVGSGQATDTMLRIGLPQGSTVQSSTEGARESSSGVEWNLGTLEPGEKREVAVAIKSGKSGQIVTEAKASAYCADEVTATGRTEVRGLPALLLEVVDASDLILVGEPVTYDIEIKNQGSAPDTNILITCEVEDGIEVISAGGGAQATISGSTITFAQIDTLEPGEIVKMQVIARSNKQFDSRFKVSLTSTQKTRPVTENEATTFYE